MKKCLIILALMLMASVAGADDMTDARNEREQAVNRLTQYESATVQLRTRIAELNGIIGYLKGKEVKDDTRNIPQDKPDSE